MNAQIPEGYMQDAKGALIPNDLVKPQAKLTDEMVRNLVASAASVQEVMRQFKQTAMSEMTGMQDLLDQEYGVKRGGQRGNLSFRSYDGSMRVEISVGDVTRFGPELKSAKALIDECIEDWAEGANDNIRVLVNAAFQVNKAKQVDKARVLGLRNLDIKDARWQRAMDAISDALMVDETRTYIRFYQKDPKSGVMKPVSLDMAVL